MHETLIHWTTGTAGLCFLPSRGRLLQATVDETEAFWVNPDGLEQFHPGGDRAWAGPEIDWFWKCRGQADLGQYVVAETLDPGSWSTEQAADGFCRWRQSCELRHLHRDARLHIEMTRSYTLVTPQDRTLFGDCIAFQTENELRILEGTVGQPVDFWSLLQVPAGGRMLIATGKPPVFQDYLEPIAPEHHAATNHGLELSITGRHQYKVGLPADVVTGRMAYIRPIASRAMVVFRQFTPMPSQPYCDVPLANIDAPGDAVQIYNDGGEFGGFGEMEYHTPALTLGEGNDHLLDTNITIVGIVETADIDAWKKHWLD